jgi:transglutaminase-like putative cysteine protease
MILKVRHATTYRYRQPVAFGVHRMMLRPIDAHDQRVFESRLDITPKPTSIQWTHDVFGNSVAHARFGGRADTLCFENTFFVDQAAKDFVVTDLDDSAYGFPFSYGSQERPDLAPFFERHSPDGQREVDDWVRTFLNADGSADTHALLLQLNWALKTTFRYVTRYEHGVQDPHVTLSLRSGSCRDLAVLLIDAARSLGMAARFVSGYLHVADDDDGDIGGHMHAWAQVYLPGPGWVDFDPASGTVGNRGLVRVAAVRTPSQSIPIQGTWIGFPSDYVDMRVKVRVSQAEDMPLPAFAYSQAM